MVLKNKINNSVLPLKQNWSIGDGLKLDGINDYIQIPHSENLNFQYNEPFSISVFVDIKTVSTSWNAILFSKYSNAIGYSARVFNTNPKMMLLSLDEGVNVFQRLYYVIPDFIDTVNHFVFINDDGRYQNQRAYFNGELMSEIYTYNNVELRDIKTTAPQLIGRYDLVHTAQSYFNAYFYDLKIFNKMLNSDEVKEIYIKKGQMVPASIINNCVLDMKFDNKRNYTLTDYYGNNGTLVNYSSGTTDIGINNSWVDKFGRPILQF